VIVLNGRGVTNLPWLLHVAHKTKSIVRQNLALALASVLVATVPTVAGIFPLWLAVTLHEGSTLLVALNSLRLLLDDGSGGSGGSSGGRGALDMIREMFAEGAKARRGARATQAALEQARSAAAAAAAATAAAHDGWEANTGVSADSQPHTHLHAHAHDGEARSCCTHGSDTHHAAAKHGHGPAAAPHAACANGHANGRANGQADGQAKGQAKGQATGGSAPPHVAVVSSAWPNSQFAE